MPEIAEIKKTGKDLGKMVGMLCPDAEPYTMASALFSTAIASAELVAGLSASVTAINSLLSTEAVAMTSALAAMGPAGWGRIAIGVGSMAISAGVVYTAMSMRMRADLSQPSESQRVAQMIGAIR